MISRLLSLIIKVSVFVLFLFGISIIAEAQTLKVATFNIRYDTPGDTGNLWVQRAPVVANLIRFHDFDLFGTQEGLKNQLDDINSALPEYARFGIGREDGMEAGEFSAIYYKKDKFKMLKGGNFWLSETPQSPSKGWDATCCNRICSWVYLEDVKSRKRFYLFNAHFDHQGKKARVESSKLMLAKIVEIGGKEPVIFTGDLNGNQTSELYNILAESPVLEDSYKQVKYPYANNGSTNAFGKELKSKQIIDHIFVSKHFQAEKWGILTDTYQGKFPSDHFPVVALINFQK